MSKSKKKDKGIVNQYLLPVLVLILVIAFALISFGRGMLSESKENVLNHYMDSASNLASLYEKEIYSVSKSAQIIADVIGESEDLFCDENKILIENAVKELSAANIYIVKTDYSAIDVKGNQYVSVVELPGYDTAFKGANTTTKFIKNADNERVMLICKPVATKTVLSGYVLIEYKPDVMATLCDSAKYPSIKTYALTSEDSTVIEKAGKESPFVVVGEKITAQNDVVYKKGVASAFKQNFNLLRAGYAEVTNSSSDEYLFVSPIAESKACVVIGVHKYYVENDYAVSSTSVRNMLITVSVIFGVFLLGIIGIFIFSRARYNLENENLQNKADTDQLTDLYNKMATERLIKEYLEGDGKDRVSMLFVIDVDNFKKINDTMGHAFGDEVLQSLGHQIKSWFRVNDIVGRIGGDEFMIFIKDIKDENVIKREGSRIMQFFEGFTVGDYTRYSPTASVGGAVFPTDATDFESLYKAADKAVYKSKKGGKNRVSFYSDLNKTE